MQTDIPGVPQSNLYASQKSTEPASQAKSADVKSNAEDVEPTVIDEMREKGFQAYVAEIQARKMEELREKILEAMGLSEEQLEEMPAEQRGQIETMVAEEIRRRMMAQATMNADNAVPGTGEASNPAMISNIQNGMNTGLALLQAIENLSEEPAISRNKESDDGAA